VVPARGPQRGPDQQAAHFSCRVSWDFDMAYRAYGLADREEPNVALERGFMKAGVLIVGSLYWDSHPERQAWRDHCLLTDGAVRVVLPIRYGKTARSRNETYTMTIGATKALGTAIILPCKPIGTFDDLMTEARALWKAEQPGCTDRKRIGAKEGNSEAWGSVGVLFREAIGAAAGVDALRSAWTKYWNANGGDSVPPVNDSGQLGIEWPKSVLGQSVDFDIILATATRDNRGKSLSEVTAEQVADLWVDHAHEYYFFNNVEHGIRTAEDLKIWRQIKKRAPPWISDQKYSRAVEMLEALVKVADGC
jgi:hypothetical protein